MKQIISIQYLQAIAALAVAYHQAFENHLRSDLRTYAFGIWGADIFFVISGLIMWLTIENSPTTAALLVQASDPVSIRPTGRRWIICSFITPDRLVIVDVIAER
jgi:hypothetical protein